VKVAYLVNQYPHVTHTFIRREIAALRALGLEVEAYSIRDTARQCVDPLDQLELARTRAILRVGARGLALAALHAATRRPARFWRALGAAVWIGYRSDRGVWRHLAYFAEAAVLQRWLAQTGAGHLHAHFATNSATVALLCELLGGPPFSMTVHGPDDFQRALSIALRDKVKLARFVVSVSDYGRRELLRWSDSAQSFKIHVVRCLLEPSDLDAPPAPVPNVRRLVCVARLDTEKGHRVLLEALASLSADGVAWELALIGDGPLRRSLEGQVAQLGLGERVLFLGWLASAEVRAAMRAARGVVLASLAENLPLALMEAYAVGRPVIATDVGGIAELVEPGVSGWLVPAGSPAMLAAALAEALATSPERLGQMAGVGRQRLLGWHHAWAQARTLQRLLEPSDLSAADIRDVSARPMLDPGAAPIAE
jgi:glycosyltransferase involved in cell wall biosynthesis